MDRGSNWRRITATRPDLIVACSGALQHSWRIIFATTLYTCRMR
jgi:hypothetical protein